MKKIKEKCMFNIIHQKKKKINKINKITEINYNFHKHTIGKDASV
jgi:hypothetical protein